MPQFIRTLASLWTLLLMLAVALFPPARSYRDRQERLEPCVAVPLAARRRESARRFAVPPPRASEVLPEPLTHPLPEPELLDPEEYSLVRPYVTELERLRQAREEEGYCPACGTAVPAPGPSAPPAYGDGLDDLRAELSPLVRAWKSQREENRAGVVR
ncbi:hypothetical protein FHX37_0014 [Haloactinospora alba]|uniref:Uncharacterized protein n=1 Tax=Haloactinospora alba TaxID=405555 RepID=A0A543NE95_9ACTN|nr:hypothetical protein [Haloactinospora alba]TQN30153.1 hypothetical protein FHX37_0014 [Haloactinospora alba]